MIPAFTSSIYIMVMVSLERYKAIKCPGQQKSWLTKCGTAGAVTLVVTFSVLFNLPKVWEHETCMICDLDENSNPTELHGQLRLEFSEIYCMPLYKLLYSSGGNILVHFVIPLVSLVYLNVRIYRRVSALHK